MKTAKEKFEENYVAVKRPANNKKGFKIVYVYYKPWHIWNLPENDLKKRKRIVFGGSLFSFAFFLLISSLYCDVNAVLLVEVPATLSIAAQLYVMMGAGQFFFSPYRVSEPTYHDVNTKLKNGLWMGICLLGLTVLGGIIYMVLYRFSFESLISTIGYGIVACMNYYIFNVYRKIPFKIEENDNLDKEEIVVPAYQKRES